MANDLVQGDLRSFSIFDLTQMLMMGRKTGAVVLSRQGGEKQGFLYFRDGEIIAAIDDSLRTGERAATTLFSWRTGTFAVDFKMEAPEVNIQVSTDYLLLEVARNIDEVTKEQSGGISEQTRTVQESEEAVGSEAKSRIDVRLKSELHAAFERVATATEPSRASYSPEVFDPLIAELQAHQGTALFLQVGRQATIRTHGGFEVVGQGEITSIEIEGFLNHLLSEQDWNELRERRELGRYYSSPKLGLFRLHIAKERGSFFLTFAAVSRTTPSLEELCPEASLASALQNTRDGLIVVAGPVGSGKSLLASSIVQAQLQDRNRLAVVFSASRQHELQSESGLCIYRDLPPAGMAFHIALRSVLEQGTDVLSIVGALEREAFHLALAAAGGNRLVIFTLESHSPTHTLHRMHRWAHTDDGDPLLDSLSRRLRWLVDLQPAAQQRIEVAASLEVDRDVQEALRTGAMELLRRKRIVSSAT